jgi:hypothetical protein
MICNYTLIAKTPSHGEYGEINVRGKLHKRKYEIHGDNRYTRYLHRDVHTKSGNGFYRRRYLNVCTDEQILGKE